jgi:TatD DNase family protein
MDGNLGVPIIDSHAHLDDAAFDADRDQVIASSRSAGIERIINIAYRPAGWEASRQLKERYSEIEVSIGLHPQYADEFDSTLHVELREAITSQRPVAIGETGFDFSRVGPSQPEQERAFRAQLEIALTEQLPVVIHQRSAADALVDELERWPELPVLVLHSFDGNDRLTSWAIERGCYVGVGGLATRRASSALRELLASVPVSQLLLETDAPYLAPPGIQSRRNEPAYLCQIARILAPNWGMTAGELAFATTTNARSVFKLPDPVSQTAL